MKNNLIQNKEEYHKKKINWENIQAEMKEKFGLDIYESWLKKINFIEEFNNYI